MTVAAQKTVVNDAQARTLLLAIIVFLCNGSAGIIRHGERHESRRKALPERRAKKPQNERLHQNRRHRHAGQRQELRLNGTIITQISHINNGEPCRREGEMTFKITGNRRYWRLAEMGQSVRRGHRLRRYIF
jgi:hypothetical protein